MLGAQGDSVRPAPVVTRGDLGILVLGAGVAFLAQRTDQPVRGELRSASWQGSRTMDAVAGLGNAWGQPGVVTLGAALWLGGRYWDNPTAAATGLRGLEAITISGVVTKVLKGSFGRARPRVSPTDAWDVEFGRGFRYTNGDYESFPSGHSTAAFAFASAVTSELARRGSTHTRLVGVTTFSLALMTAYARMHVDAHWLSDVAMGAAIGTATGLAVTRWHATRPGNRFDHLLLGADAEGAVVGARFAWR